MELLNLTLQVCDFLFSQRSYIYLGGLSGSRIIIKVPVNATSDDDIGIILILNDHYESNKKH